MKILIWKCENNVKDAATYVHREFIRQGYEDIYIAEGRNNPRMFLMAVRKIRPDWIISFPNIGIPRQIYTTIKNRFNCKIMVWYPDQCDANRDRAWRSLSGIFDIAAFSILHAAETYKDVVGESYWIPQYFDYETCKPLPKRLDETKEIYDLCFLTYAQDNLRQQWLHELGQRYKLVVSDNHRGQDMAAIYAQTKIAFNIQREQFLNPGKWISSNRIYNAMGCGCFFISHYVKNMELMFKVGCELVMHNDSLDDLCRIIDYYLKHENEREKIALTGQAKILNKHCLSHRIPLYYELMKNYGDKKPINHYFGG